MIAQTLPQTDAPTKQPKERYLFLQKDFDALIERIEQQRTHLNDVSKAIGTSCTQSSETWHDNFGFEEHTRQHTVALQSLSELERLRNNGEVFTPRSSNETVAIGKYVFVKNEHSNDTTTYFIGSFRIFEERFGKEISYTSPIGTALLGKHVGERAVAKTEKKEIPLTVLAISDLAMTRP